MANKRKAKAKSNNGSPAATRQAESRWLGRLGMYHTKRALTFESKDELRKAIDFLWNPSDELYRMPHAPAAALTMIVPDEAVPVFRSRGLRFKEYPVMPAARSRSRDGSNAGSGSKR